MANGLSARDERLVKFAIKRMSPAEVEIQTGWPAEVVARETRRLLESYDSVYDDRQQLQLMKLVQARHVARLESEAEDGNKDSWKPLLDGLKNWQSQIENSMKRTDADLEKVNAAQARVLLDIVQSSFDRTLGALKERYPEISVDEIEETFRTHLVAVATEREEREG